MIKKTKRKTRIMSAIAATIVAALALFVPLSASAQVQLPAPASYNFQNLTNANMSSTPSALRDGFANYGITLTDSYAYSGSFTFTATQFNTANRSVVLSQSIKELAPYLKQGDSIVISWDTTIEATYTSKFQLLTGSTFGNFYSSGETITVTNDFLNSYIVFYPIPANSEIGTQNVYSSFRINLNEQQPFEPYSTTQNYVTYLNSIYTGAYNTGVSNGVNSVHPENAFFTSANLLELGMFFYDEESNSSMLIAETPESEERDRFDMLVNSSALDGYTINTAIIPPDVFALPDGYEALTDLSLFFDVGEVKAGNLEFSVNLPQQTGVRVQLFTNIGEAYVASAGFTNDFSTLNQSYTITSSAFGVSDDLVIRAIAIEFSVRFFYPNLTPPGYWRDTVPDMMLTTRTHDYADGYTNGYANGFNNGYNDGEQNGIKTGYSEGFNAGTKEGNKNGYQNGYKNGYNNGKNDGYALGAKGTTFYDLIYSVIQAPINAFTGMLEFEVLGVNMRTFYVSMLSLGVVLFVLRKLSFW